MNLLCPFSDKQIDKKAARLNALIVFGLLLIIILSDHKWIIFILCADFFIRGFTGWPLSPVAALSKSACKAVMSTPGMINAGPKIFAAKIGFVFSAVVSILVLLKYGPAVQAVSILFAAAAGLDGFFGFCVACHLYTVLNRTRTGLGLEN